MTKSFICIKYFFPFQLNLEKETFMARRIFHPIERLLHLHPPIFLKNIIVSKKYMHNLPTDTWNSRSFGMGLWVSTNLVLDWLTAYYLESHWSIQTLRGACEQNLWANANEAPALIIHQWLATQLIRWSMLWSTLHAIFLDGGILNNIF